MFLHLGGDAVVPLREVVAIFDRELATQSRAAEEFLQTAKDEGFLIDVSGGRPKSFVLTSNRVYLSQISSVTLKKRAENISEYLEELAKDS
ncbi:MAG: extracellular matrix regulator RemB [Betaproteobacteria bacterium]